MDGHPYSSPACHESAINYNYHHHYYLLVFLPRQRQELGAGTEFVLFEITLNPKPGQKACVGIWECKGCCTSSKVGPRPGSMPPWFQTAPRRQSHPPQSALAFPFRICNAQGSESFKVSRLRTEVTVEKSNHGYTLWNHRFQAQGLSLRECPGHLSTN